jgi:hypothetical protein
MAAPPNEVARPDGVVLMLVKLLVNEAWLGGVCGASPRHPRFLALLGYDVSAVVIIARSGSASADWMTSDNEIMPRLSVLAGGGLGESNRKLPYHTQLIHIHGNRATNPRQR